MSPFMTFDSFVNNIYLPYAEKNFEKSTYASHVKDLRVAQEFFGGKWIIFLGKRGILAFLKMLEDKGLKQNTIWGYLKAVRAVFNFALKKKCALWNPCKGVRIKQILSRAETFTAAEVKQLLEYIQMEYPSVWLPVYLAVNTGMRRGEVLGLTWRNVDLEKKEIFVCQSLCLTVAGDVYIKAPKTKSSIRKIAISDDVVEVLQREKERGGCEYVVANYGGVCCMNPDYLTHCFYKAVRGAGVPHLRFHDLRHTHASLMLAAGVNIKLISERLGHSNIDITLKLYAHLLPNAQHEAAEKFSEIFKEREEESIQKAG